jgi:hypothetical protein
MCALAKQSPFVVRDRRGVDFTRDGGAARYGIPTYSSNSLENALSKFAPNLWAVI